MTSERTTRMIDRPAYTVGQCFLHSGDEDTRGQYRIISIDAHSIRAVPRTQTDETRNVLTLSNEATLHIIKD